MKKVDFSTQIKYLHVWLPQLAERVQQVLYLRVLLDAVEPFTFATISSQITLHRQLVRRSESKSILNLKLMSWHFLFQNLLFSSSSLL